MKQHSLALRKPSIHVSYQSSEYKKEKERLYQGLGLGEDVGGSIT